MIFLHLALATFGIGFLLALAAALLRAIYWSRYARESDDWRFANVILTRDAMLAQEARWRVTQRMDTWSIALAFGAGLCSVFGLICTILGGFA
jgi:hypothetical protein